MANRAWYITGDRVPVNWAAVVVDGKATATVYRVVSYDDAAIPYAMAYLWASPGAYVSGYAVTTAQGEQSSDAVPLVSLRLPTPEYTSGGGGTGAAGPPGKSAYELAVTDGYVGTVTEWLASLGAPTGYDVTAETTADGGVTLTAPTSPFGLTSLNAAYYDTVGAAAAEEAVIHAAYNGTVTIQRIKDAA